MARALATVGLDSVAEAWIASDRPRRKSELTKAHYRDTWGRFRASLIRADRAAVLDDLSLVEPEDIERFMGEQPSPATGRTRYWHIRGLFTFATKYHEDVLPRHPMRALDAPVDERKEARAFPTYAEFLRLVATAERDIRKRPRLDYRNGRRDRAILELLVASGLRRSEVGSLNVGDIDDRAIHVRSGKGGKARTARMDGKAAEAVREYLTRVRPTHPKRHDTEALFLGAAGRLSGDAVGDVVRSRAVSAGMEPPWTAHQLRHLWTFLCDASAMDPRWAEYLGGWSVTHRGSDGRASHRPGTYGASGYAELAAREYDAKFRRPEVR